KIEIADLTVQYDGAEALKGISFDVYENEILGIIGPAQSGKTTLLRTINRTIEFEPSARVSGSVKIDGTDVKSIKNVNQLRRRIGMVFPLPVGLPLSIYDNVAFAPRTAGMHKRSELNELVERRKKSETDDIVEAALREVFLWDDLKDQLKVRATTLQLEQQQKLCIARLLPLKPRVILMDEPCSALDAKGTRAVEELMLELAGHYTILIVTHNMAQARRISDECIFMLLGEIVEHSRTEDLFLMPQNEKTEDYIEGRYG
ncbi:Phosphate import ATP-binding protein PstB 3, partial [Geodia barretti]